ncbi:MAG: flagellar export chaperone FliS [Deltaproteobacteria bacterium]|nr:flagellar export chaperone FliS [Deltaproteobacteria bacterium]
MVYRRFSNQYQKTSMVTAGRLELIIMCYEKVIQSLQQVKVNYEAGAFEAKAKALQRGLNIINELQCSLDCERGGEIAKNLDALYAYLTRRLLEGDLKEDLSAFDEVIHIMNELKGAWEGIASGRDTPVDPQPAPEQGKLSFAQIAV